MGVGLLWEWGMEQVGKGVGLLSWEGMEAGLLSAEDMGAGLLAEVELDPFLALVVLFLECWTYR